MKDKNKGFSEEKEKETESPRGKTPENLSPFAKPTDWQGGAKSDDSLLGALEILAGLLGRSMSAAAFKAGLPLINNKLTPDLFVRAADRAGIAAQIVRKKLGDISPLTLPCVLVLEGNKACLLVEKEDEKLKVIFPEVGRGASELSVADLDKLYGGFAIFAQPQYRYDQRSVDLDVERPTAWFWGTLFRFWPIYSQVAMSAVLVNIFAIVSPLFVMTVYDRVVPNSATDTLWILAIGVLIVFGFDFLLKMLRVYFVDVAGKNADIILASRIYEQVLSIQMASKPSSSGGFANQLREFETVREFVSSATLVALVDLPFVFLFVGVIAFIGGKIAYIPLLSIPIVIIATLIFQGPLSAWVRRAFREGAQKHALLVESIHGLETIKSFGAESRMQRSWETFVNQSAESGKSLRLVSSLALNFSGFVQQASYIAVIIFGVYLIIGGELTMGGLIACSILSARAMAPLAQVVNLLTRLNQTRTALEALDKILKLPVERSKNLNYLNRPILKGDIEFKDAKFAYPSQKTPALKDFSLTLKAGEKVGLVGRIGSGKSTVEKLILNLYQAQEGTLKIDGTDIRQIDPADLRKNIGYMPQDIFLFFGSVRDNVAFGSEDMDDEAILRAAEISGVNDFVRSHPEGFDMPVGEGGANLSGGQRQSIAAARALIRDPSIRIMDEPTAMMDNTSEARFVMRLKQIIASKTVILISHRMPVLQLVDRLIVMDGGRIVADGPRDEVIRALSSSQIRSAG